MVPVGRHRLQHNLRQLTADSSSSTEADGELGAESARNEAVAPRALTDCWVCRGTGKASSALPSAMERATVVDSKVGEEEEEEELCLICWCDPAEFGLVLAALIFSAESASKGTSLRSRNQASFLDTAPAARQQPRLERSLVMEESRVLQ